MTEPQKNIFKKIIDGELPADIVYEDELCLAFRDINPQAPVHVLIVPKRDIPALCEAGEVDEPLLGHLLAVTARIARKLKLENGYRTVINCGPDAGQVVDHLHVHLLGGREFGWPPG